MAVGKLFVEEYFDEHSKNKVSSLEKTTKTFFSVNDVYSFQAYFLKFTICM